MPSRRSGPHAGDGFSFTGGVSASGRILPDRPDPCRSRIRGSIQRVRLLRHARPTHEHRPNGLPRHAHDASARLFRRGRQLRGPALAPVQRLLQPVSLGWIDDDRPAGVAAGEFSSPRVRRRRNSAPADPSIRRIVGKGAAVPESARSVQEPYALEISRSRLELLPCGSAVGRPDQRVRSGRRGSGQRPSGRIGHEIHLRELPCSLIDRLPVAAAVGGADQKPVARSPSGRRIQEVESREAEAPASCRLAGENAVVSVRAAGSRRFGQAGFAQAADRTG
uniref:Predicted protein n=1 Tax=Physcomitrium patens TaxID=3218 RepID=A9U7T9_PHYPA